MYLQLSGREQNNLEANYIFFLCYELPFAGEIGLNFNYFSLSDQYKDCNGQQWSTIPLLMFDLG